MQVYVYLHAFQWLLFYYCCQHIKIEAGIAVGYVRLLEHIYTPFNETYRIAGNFGGKNSWRIALIMAFGGFYFGGWVTLYHYYIHSKMVTYVTDRNGSNVNTAESISNHSTSNEAGTS